MATSPLLLTAEGKDHLVAELSELEAVKRPNIIAQFDNDCRIDDVDQATEDLRNQLTLTERRIADIKKTLASAALLEVPSDTSYVSPGSTVTIEGGMSGTFTIVGSPEARAAAGRISNDSPLGRALLGAVLGQTIQINAPSGAYDVVVTGIQ